MNGPEPIDVQRCLRALNDIHIGGRPDGSVRHTAIADAIAAILRDGARALTAEYIAVKQYSRFGDQREDHSYGRGPAHGTILFEICRTRRGGVPAVLGADHAYLLECVRDFGVIQSPQDVRQSLNLCELLKMRSALSGMVAQLDDALAAARIESHEERP